MTSCGPSRCRWTPTGGIACLLHALLPFLFVKTGSRIITELHDRMVANRARQAAPTPAAPRDDRGERRAECTGAEYGNISCIAHALAPRLP